jgi:phosphate transport system ATP-binding protein
MSSGRPVHADFVKERPRHEDETEVRSEWTTYEFTGEAAFSIRNLSVYYDDDTAIDNVSFDIPPKSVTALIGPSGCGKSTLIRCLNRLNDQILSAHVEGAVEFNGVDIYQRRVNVVELRKRVGQVFQEPNPFPKSIRDNVTFGPRKHGDIDRSILAKLLGRYDRDQEDELIRDCLERAALWEEVKDRLEESALGLSGGQQQRLCIARALATDPEVLLMDEPASAIDPIATAKIEDLIRDLAEDYTVVVVTHNMEQAQRISDQTAVLLTGGVLGEYGETTQVFQNAANPRVEQYIDGEFG